MFFLHLVVISMHSNLNIDTHLLLSLKQLPFEMSKCARFLINAIIILVSGVMHFLRARQL